MKLKEFVTEVAKELEQQLEGVKAIPTNSMKNNGVIQHGVLLRMNDAKISPVLYLDFLFKRFKKGELTMPEIVKKVIDEYEGLPSIDVSDFEESLADRDLLGKINIRLLNKEANKKMIAKNKLVHYDIEGTDLVALFYLDVVSGDGVIGGAGLVSLSLPCFTCIPPRNSICYPRDSYPSIACLPGCN